MEGCVEESGLGEEPSGERFGRYVLLERLGQGGMGVVYRAFDPRLRRHVALKLLLPDRADQNARLIREAQSMAKVSDPGVVQVYDAGFADGQVFIAMELVEGPTLLGWLRARRRSWNEILDIFVAAGRGLATAHAANLIHRDFKPSNVLVAPSGRVLVSDFGIAAPIDRNQTRPSQAALEAYDSVENEAALHTITLTQSGQGTPRYMAPEQREGRTIEPRADQYSYCVALTEALRDHPVPEAVMSCLRKGLSHTPAARFASMNELLHALSVARAPKTQRSPRLAWGWGLASLAAVTLIAVVGISTDGASRAATPVDSQAVVGSTTSGATTPAATAATTATTATAATATPSETPEQSKPAESKPAETKTAPNKTVETPVAVPTHTARKQQKPRAKPRRKPRVKRQRSSPTHKSTPATTRQAKAPSASVPDELIRDLWTAK